jgi:hypothetical protein
MDLDAAAFESKNENSQKLLKGVEEFHTYVERNQEFVPNYGSAIATGKGSLPVSSSRRLAMFNENVGA